ncbi:hypothetical protein SARC_13015 [Sphaeroforma arctica JP610]|uniref:Uncharacterized protein n=1 Tax=Sphaeroforma arctica JP610 TaxID=667725 RepID=A0A0L0FD78_9EUKA|nr:hypothetical protein SARC_13015 [Sphaeroforma arctica JP610]KNC74436.1 hypothetical protein SARC_13015 [Sphaeroforma arctica JP610]|eukprot:XP_014148338.1 hypothetical protein SARC_13015 [Sphaeroforma arctica JP610]
MQSAEHLTSHNISFGFRKRIVTFDNMKFYSTALLLAAASVMVMAASPKPMEHMCSMSNNNGKCEGLNKMINTSQGCNMSGDDKCSTSHCCMDHPDDHDKDNHDKDDQDKEEHKDEHDKDEHKDEKDHKDEYDKDSGDHETTCSDYSNQGKCKSLDKSIKKGKGCNRYGDDKCATSHCCK